MLLPLQGRRIAYDLVGPEDAPTVCITHSLASDGGSWAEQVPALLAGGFQVLRLAMPGHIGIVPVVGGSTTVALGAARHWSTAEHQGVSVPRLPSERDTALVVCGADDPGTPDSEDRRLASLVPGARYEEIAGCLHFPNVERPDEFNRIMMGWLETHKRAR